MITAKDVSKMLNEYDSRIDLVLEQYIIPLFLSRHTRKITTTHDKLTKELGSNYTVNRIISELEKRGFIVRYECDDRPCGSCWFEISLPPDVE